MADPASNYRGPTRAPVGFARVLLVFRVSHIFSFDAPELVILLSTSVSIATSHGDAGDDIGSHRSACADCEFVQR